MARSHRTHRPYLVSRRRTGTSPQSSAGSCPGPGRIGGSGAATGGISGSGAASGDSVRSTISTAGARMSVCISSFSITHSYSRGGFPIGGAGGGGVPYARSGSPISGGGGSSVKSRMLSNISHADTITFIDTNKSIDRPTHFGRETQKRPKSEIDRPTHIRNEAQNRNRPTYLYSE
eukprot:14869523-Heterocapsa_arctica.AAC.1